MDAEVQKFLDTWKAKSEAKAETMVALGEAKLAEYEGRDDDATRYWAVVAAKGMAGDEGRLQAEAFALAEAYVAAHPDFFAGFERYVNPDDHGLLVKLLGIMGKEKRYEDEGKLMMFEMARFERQHIGQRLAVVVKPRGGVPRH